MWPVRRIFLLIFHSPRRRLVYKDRGMVLFMCLLMETTRELQLWIFLRWVVDLVSVLTGNIDWKHNQQRTGTDRNKISSLSNGDGDVNENDKKAIGFLAKQQLCTFITLFVHLTWKCLISRFMKDVNKRWQILLSLFKIYGRTHVKIMRQWKSALMLTRKRLETGDISRRHDWFPREMTSEERALKNPSWWRVTTAQIFHWLKQNSLTAEPIRSG